MEAKVKEEGATAKATSAKISSKEKGPFAFMKLGFLNPSRILEAAAARADEREMKAREKNLVKREEKIKKREAKIQARKLNKQSDTAGDYINNGNNSEMLLNLINFKISDLSKELEVSVKIGEANDSRTADSNGDVDERENREEMLELFPGGNRDAVKYMLDAIAPYCDDEKKLHDNLKEGKKCGHDY